MKRLSLVIFFIFLVFDLSAFEKSDTFNVIVYDKKIKVLAPQKFYKNLSVIVENKMTKKLVGKLIKNTGELIDYSAIEPLTSASLKVKMDKKEKLFFIPLAPAFQEVELLVGKRSYEIPPKR